MASAWCSLLVLHWCGFFEGRLRLKQGCVSLLALGEVPKGLS